MADKREHRGPHPEDATLFAEPAIPRLRVAVVDYSWLLTRGYAQPSALKVVGDHHLLNARQRIAVMRCACSDQARLARHERQVTPAEGASLLLDGYNVLTTVEAALAGGVLIIGRDACMRDMASMHGSWRKVTETRPAIGLIGASLPAGTEATWLLDAPVSNSGRLKTMILQTAADHGWRWAVELVASPDAQLKCAGGVIATADSAILDACGQWTNLAAEVVRRHVPSAWIVDLDLRAV